MKLFIQSLIIKHFIQIDSWLNRLNIFDGADQKSMLIGEVHGISDQPGISDHKLTKSISSSGKALFIDFKKQHNTVYTQQGVEVSYLIVEVLVKIKYKKMNSYCQTWFDLENNVLMTPADLNAYNKSINCNWLVTANIGSYITLKFPFIDVIFH